LIYIYIYIYISTTNSYFPYIQIHNPNYRMALNFLTEIALQALRTDKGRHPATAPATSQEDYSGDLKPKTTNNKGPITLPPQKLPFSWPDLNPKRQRSLPNKQN
jgi:hypothetical protein